tara:strand:+ start:2138 stop:2737 length:600 start_codon:yes stop_codon:yes gene_type:complete
MKYYENFLDNYLDIDLLKELKSISNWKDFNRNSSHMKEFYDETQWLKHLRCHLHSRSFIQWVETETNLTGLVVDPLGTGEGVSLMQKNDMLDSHIDFNWNDRIKMHRAVNLLIYLGDCFGGEFEIWDDKKENVIFEANPIHNSAVIFTHSETQAHGVRKITSGRRYSIRQFYYKSEATCENPHQSLYWYNPESNMPTNS